MLELKNRRRVQAKCKSCGAAADTKLVAAVALEVQRRQEAASLEQKKTLLSSIADLKAQHTKDLGEVAKSQRKESIQGRKYAEVTRRDRMFYEQELLRIRAAFSTSIAHLKDAYIQQSRAIAELRTAVLENAESIPAQIEGLAETYKVELQDHRKWLEQSLASTILEQLGSALTSTEDTEIERDRLSNVIAERDSQIALAMDRIGQLEAMLAAKRGRAIWRRMRKATAEPYKEERQAEPQEAILDIIREIAQERKRMTASNESEENPIGHFADSFGSRMSVKASH